jgi:hypothetical protein
VLTEQEDTKSVIPIPVMILKIRILSS